MSTSSIQSRLLKPGTPTFDEALERGAQSPATAQQQAEEPEFEEQMYSASLLEERAWYRKWKKLDLCCRNCDSKV
jgi:hypothetical protein